MVKLVVWTCLAALAMIMIIPRGGDAPVVAAAAVTVDSADDSKARRVDTGGAEVIIERARDRHFYTTAQVNGARVRFLVDSGASAVVLTRRDAQAAGISAVSSDFTGLAKTANGTARFKPVKLDRVAIGALVATDVDAAVIEDGLDISLLGQSFLERVGKVEIEGDEMRLR